ncbi:hypothetical protein D3C72_1298800 [compost metagenome]
MFNEFASCLNHAIKRRRTNGVRDVIVIFNDAIGEVAARIEVTDLRYRLGTHLVTSKCIGFCGRKLRFCDTTIENTFHFSDNNIKQTVSGFNVHLAAKVPTTVVEASRGI